MDSLQAIFPGNDTKYLQSVLDYCKNSVEQAVDFILSGAELPEQKNDKNRGNSLNKFVVDYLRETLGTNCDFSDVELRTSDGVTVFAHEVILGSRSELMHILLQSIPSEPGRPKKLNLSDTGFDISHKLLTYLLEYIYTDTVQLPDVILADMLSLADGLDLGGLRKKCELGIDSVSNTIGDDFLKVLNSPEYPSDITFMVQDKPILCHKIILCGGSEYFRAMFKLKMAESSKSVIQIEDQQYEVFLSMLTVIYSNGKQIQSIINAENALDLFLVSNRYIVSSLQNECERYIKENLDVDNVCQILELASPLSDSLKFYCLKFIYAYYDDIKNTDTFKNNGNDTKNLIEQCYLNFKRDTVNFFENTLSLEQMTSIETNMKSQLASFLNKNLPLVAINQEIKGEVDSSTEMGRISFLLSNFKLQSSLNFRLVKNKDIDVQFNISNLEMSIAVYDIPLKMINSDWFFSQTKDPFHSEEGQFSTVIHKASIQMNFCLLPSSIASFSSSRSGSFSLPELQMKKFEFTYESLKPEMSYMNTKKIPKMGMLKITKSSKILTKAHHGTILPWED
eukprot:TRINITY_DN5460_c0_g1_i2.p1 TRINITY_DN5460_c0_g1~~TRINITY_DN5460_c0_g1_i2.p1  ORF type:complete len:565 (-),score=49.18 TRINITY_DN5460_c0_g1_i2:150-1844(-)